MPVTGRPRTTDRERILKTPHVAALVAVELATNTVPAPDWMTDVAKAKWAELLPLLCEVGLPVMDLDNLELYCVTYAAWKQAMQEIRRDGTTLVDDKGKMYIHPALGHCTRYVSSMQTLGKILGLSNKSRQTIHTPPKENPETSALGQFMADSDVC